MTAGIAVGSGCRTNLDNMAPTDNADPAKSQTVLLGGWLHPFRLRSVGCTTSITAFNRRPLSKRRLSFLPFHTALVVSCVFFSTAAALKVLLYGGPLRGGSRRKQHNGARNHSIARYG